MRSTTRTPITNVVIRNPISFHRHVVFTSRERGAGSVNSRESENRTSPIKGNVKRNTSPSARCRHFFVSAFSPTV
jgi:hypothetical protein